jgi:hypothetical protein
MFRSFDPLIFRVIQERGGMDGALPGDACLLA